MTILHILLLYHIQFLFLLVLTLTSMLMMCWIYVCIPYSELYCTVHRFRT
jgi:hypothetical protein